MLKHSSPEEEVISFYNDLAEVTSNVPAHNVLLICGDLNAKLGRDHVRYSFHQSTNRNGEHLLDFLQSFNLVASNCHFQKPARKIWTFTYPNKTREQLDYILVRRKWLNSVKDCEPFSSTFSSLCSDHRPLSMRIRLSLRAQKVTSDPSRSVNFRSLTLSKDLRNDYAITVSNRFSSLLHEDSEDPPLQSRYDVLSDTCIEVGKQMLPKKPKQKWTNLSKSENVISARKKLIEVKNTKSSSDILEAKEHLNKEYKIAEASYIETQARLIENASYT